MLGLKIRPAVSGDGEAILDCVQNFARQLGVMQYTNTQGHIEKITMADLVKTDGAVERLEHDLALPTPPFQCFLAEAYSRIVGCLPYYRGFSSWNFSLYPWFDELDGRDVLRTGDNRTVRTELFRQLERSALEAGYPRIETRAPVAHAGTRILYSELGMEIKSEWELYRSELSASPISHTPPSNILVRRAEHTDARELVNFIVSSARAQRMEHEVNRHEPIEKLGKAIQKNWCEFLIADVDVIPEGFAAFYSSYSFWEQRESMMIEDMHVLHQNHETRGVGTAMLSELKSIAEERGYPRIETRVLVSSPTAPRATKFLISNGFHVVVPKWRTFRRDLRPLVITTSK